MILKKRNYSIVLNKSCLNFSATNFYFLFLILITFTLSGCKLFSGDKLVATTTITKKKTLNATLTSVNVANNQITITGSGFSSISSVKLQENELIKSYLCTKDKKAVFCH